MRTACNVDQTANIVRVDILLVFVVVLSKVSECTQIQKPSWVLQALYWFLFLPLTSNCKIQFSIKHLLILSSKQSGAPKLSKYEFHYPFKTWELSILFVFERIRSWALYLTGAVTTILFDRFIYSSLNSFQKSWLQSFSSNWDAVQASSRTSGVITMQKYTFALLQTFQSTLFTRCGKEQCVDRPRSQVS